jgi:acylphosphatase
MLNHRICLIIYGLVQGVFYRASTKEKAKELGLVGWVKNRPDGSVEIAVEGDQDSISELVQWCHKGPSSARVDNVSIIDLEGEENFTKFEIR